MDCSWAVSACWRVSVCMVCWWHVTKEPGYAAVSLRDAKCGRVGVFEVVAKCILGDC